MSNPKTTFTIIQILNHEWRRHHSSITWSAPAQTKRTHELLVSMPHVSQIAASLVCGDEGVRRGTRGQSLQKECTNLPFFLSFSHLFNLFFHFPFFLMLRASAIPSEGTKLISGKCRRWASAKSNITKYSRPVNRGVRNQPDELLDVLDQLSFIHINCSKWRKPWKLLPKDEVFHEAPASSGMGWKPNALVLEYPACKIVSRALVKRITIMNEVQRERSETKVKENMCTTHWACFRCHLHPL